MNLPSNLAHGGSLETVPQRRSCMARSGVVKVAITAGALSKEAIKKTQQRYRSSRVSCIVL